MKKLLFYFVALALNLVSSASLSQQSNFQPWSENLFLQIEKEHGKPGADRMRKLHDIIVKNIDKPVAVKLQVTNDALNQLPWLTDREKYNQDDYWATPLETITTFGGDCEDIAIAKYMMLRVLGIAKEKLFLGYARVKKTGESHMVLVYIEDPENLGGNASALVLDNYVTEILPGKERNDLIGVYLVDADRNVTLLSDDGTRRKVKTTMKQARMDKLEKVKKKIIENHEIGKQYNDGRPLY